MTSEATIRQALSRIFAPSMKDDIVASGMVSGIVIKDTNVGVMLTLPPHLSMHHASLQQAVEHTLAKVDGVDKVTVMLTAHHDSPVNDSPPLRKATWNLRAIDNVKQVIVIASGKGGVGKSTVTALLALQLARNGQRVGIIDADIYGPSIPQLFGLSAKPDTLDGRMVPPVVADIQLMSVGLLLEAGQAAIMRGPMISKTLNQLLRGTLWGQQDAPLDTLLVDMPPGTGDIHLSLIQHIPLSANGGGAIIVTTPQEMALIDARKCITMFHKTHTLLLGIIENMSYFEDAHGVRHHLFGKDGGLRLAQENNLPLLGSYPLDPELRQAADIGKISEYTDIPTINVV